MVYLYIGRSGGSSVIEYYNIPLGRLETFTEILKNVYGYTLFEEHS